MARVLSSSMFAIHASNKFILSLEEAIDLYLNTHADTQSKASDFQPVRFGGSSKYKKSICCQFVS